MPVTPPRPPSVLPRAAAASRPGRPRTPGRRWRGGRKRREMEALRRPRFPDDAVPARILLRPPWSAGFFSLAGKASRCPVAGSEAAARRLLRSGVCGRDGAAGPAAPFSASVEEKSSCPSDARSSQEKPRGFVASIIGILKGDTNSFNMAV